MRTKYNTISHEHTALLMLSSLPKLPRVSATLHCYCCAAPHTGWSSDYWKNQHGWICHGVSMTSCLTYLVFGKVTHEAHTVYFVNKRINTVWNTQPVYCHAINQLRGRILNQYTLILFEKKIDFLPLFSCCCVSILLVSYGIIVRYFTSNMLQQWSAH